MPHDVLPSYAMPTARAALREFAVSNGIQLTPTSPPGSAEAKRTRKISSTLSSSAASLARLATGFTRKLSFIPDATRTLIDSETTITGDDDSNPLEKFVGTKAKINADALYFSGLDAKDATQPGEDPALETQGKAIQPPFFYVPGGVQSPPPVPAPACVSPTQATRERSLGPTSAILGRSSSWAASYPTFTLNYLKRFGEGGMSESFLARITFPKSKEEAGLAFVKHIDKGEVERARNYSEIRAYERVSAVGPETLPYVAGMQAFVDHPEIPYYILIFYVYAFDLHHAMNRLPSLSKKNTEKWLAQVATGLRDLHSVGIIHRDMKLENVLIDWNWDAHITDLGLAYVDSECKPLQYTESYCNHHCGTTLYMAPEVQAVATEFEKMERRMWTLYDPEETKGLVKLYGPGVDWSSFGTMLYEVVARANNTPVPALTPMDRLAIKKACHKFHKHKSMERFTQVMNDRRVPGTLHGLLLSLWAHPSIRGNYTTCYHSEFFHDIESDGPIFDILYKLSAEAERYEIPTSHYKEELPVPYSLDVEHAYADPNLDGEKIDVSWIRPKTDMFNVRIHKSD